MSDSDQSRTLLIAADICPIEQNKPLLQSGAAERLFNGLLQEFAQADLLLANLECPLIECPSPILKTGPTFGEPADCLNGIKAAGFNVLSLANNHILDHGANGLKATMKACAAAGISTVGAGDNLEEARRVLVKDLDGIRVGILSMAEHEFSLATATTPGANPVDLIEFVQTVRTHRSEWDYLVVLFHGAHEFQAITPRVQKTCRFFIEMGANAVLVQHPHALGGYENYRGGHIVYGQGALLMDEAIYRSRESFHEGFIAKLNVTRRGSSTMEIIPFTQSDPEPGARRSVGDRAIRFLQVLEDRSLKIQNPAFVAEEWTDFCRKNRHAYWASLLGFNRVMHRLNRTGFLTSLLYGKRPLLGVRNLVQCETHREAIQTIFDEESRGRF